MPNSGAFMLAAGRVKAGIGTISRSLNTLMPNSLGLSVHAAMYQDGITAVQTVGQG